MKCVIPIKNFLIDDIVELDGAIFVPIEIYEYKEQNRDFYEEEMELVEKVFSILDNCYDEYNSKFKDYTTIIIDYPITIKQYENTVAIEDFYLLEQICIQADRALDKLRLMYCYFGNKEYLPGIAGIINNYQQGIIVDMDNNISRTMLGNVYITVAIPGIGLYLENKDFLVTSKKFDAIFKNDRTDEVFMSCRNAITRINEAFYFNNYNVSFVYLMSTLDMLASGEYMQFKKVKTKIVSFIATSKNDYHNKCEIMKKFSEDIRTEVVHNGKNIYDLMSHRELMKSFGIIILFIKDYCENVIDTGITNFEDLNKLRELKIKSFM